MKKLTTVFACLAILYAAVLVYVGIRYDPHSGYWLAFELFFFVLILSAHFYKALTRKENGKWGVFFPVIFILLWCGYYSFREIAKYNSYLCFDKFGPEFNARRHSLGVPLIPADWQEGYAFNHSVDWKQKDSVASHHSKTISIDSTCTIVYETDEYRLKPIGGKSRDIWVETKYARGKSKDSIFFSYYSGDTTRNITKLKADSIFDADKIKKDY
jgi:hypothetical protein